MGLLHHPLWLLKASFSTFGTLFFNFFNYFLWLRITDEGLIPEMHIWSILLIISDLKWCIHLSRSLYLMYHKKLGLWHDCYFALLFPRTISETDAVRNNYTKFQPSCASASVAAWSNYTSMKVLPLPLFEVNHGSCGTDLAPVITDATSVSLHLAPPQSDINNSFPFWHVQCCSLIT